MKLLAGAILVAAGAVLLGMLYIALAVYTAGENPRYTSLTDGLREHYGWLPLALVGLLLLGGTLLMIRPRRPH